MLKSWHKHLGIFLLSLSLLTYEIGLSRLISAMFRYHYAFLVISFAVLGLGFGGFLLHLFRRKETIFAQLLIKTFGLTYLLTLVVIYFMPFAGSPILYILIGTLPFISGGAILAYFFKEKGQKIGSLYFADLLGSTMGAVLVLLIFQQFGTFAGICLITGVAFIAPLFLSTEGKFRLVQIGMAVVMFGLVLIPGFVNWGENAFVGFYTSPNAGNNQSQKSEFVYWDSFSRTDVFAKNDQQKVLVLDGSAASYMYRFDGNLESIAYLKDKIGYLPLGLQKPEKVLLIGPGGGEDILQALLAGVKDITAVEINKGSVIAVGAMADFTGDIYNLPEVRTYIQDGRNFVEQTKEKFDQIYLSLVMTNLNDQGSKVLVENYIYTEEAISAYLNSLTDDGMITFLMHDRQDYSKLVTTILDLLTKRGVKREMIAKYMLGFVDPRNNHEHHTGMYPVLMLAKNPLSEEKSILWHNKLIETRNQIIHVPYIFEDNIIGDYAKGTLDLNSFIKRTSLNLAPVIDDRPFIYQYEKFTPTYLKTLLIAVLGLLSVGYLHGWRSVGKEKKYPTKMLYFVFLGAGFMMLEIVLMQRFAIYLGVPTLTFVSVLGILLFSSGVGSYFHEKIVRRVNPLLAAGGYAILLNLLIQPVVLQTISLGPGAKLGIIFALTAPLGFFLGMAFPQGLTRLKEMNNEGLIPLVWALNGVASVAGSILTIVIALKLGFTVVNWIGAGLYLANYFIWKGTFATKK